MGKSISELPRSEDVKSDGDFEDNWIEVRIRIQNKYDILCSFLNYKASIENKETKVFYNELIEFSLKYIEENGFNFEITKYNGRREPKGFLLKDKTFKYMKDSFSKYEKIYLNNRNRKIVFGDFLEVLLFIYCQNKLDKRDKEFLNYNWGIEEIKCKKM